MNSRSDSSIPNLRWWIITTCFLITTVNYLDRQCLSVSAATISREFGFSNADYSSIVGAFLAAYTVMQLVSGAIADRIGTRRAMALFLAWWSAAGMLHAFGNGLWSFRTLRFALGMGEAGNWPTATKVVSEWFPARERGLAVAIFDSGSALGGALAPPLVAWLIAAYSWRYAFVVTGSLGFLLLALWLWIYRRPEEHKLLGRDELSMILEDRARQPMAIEPKAGTRRLLGRQDVWGIIAGRLLTDCVWWFYVYWMPKYLADQRGLSLGQIAALGWLPFLTVDLGNLGGGWLSGRMVRGGWTIAGARRAVLAIGAVAMLGGIPAGLTSDTQLCVALIALATFGYGAWGTMMLALPTDMFPSSSVGIVSGLSGTGAGLGGILFTWLIGAIADRLSFEPIFIMAGILPVLAFVLVHHLILKSMRS